MKMKWKISVFLAATFLISLAALYAGLLSYDFNRLKPEIISTVRGLTGRELAIKGDIRVAFGLLPSLVIEDVSLRNASWGSRRRMLHIRRFEMQLALLPLLRGTIEIRKVALFNSEIFLEKNRKGILNLPVPSPGPPADKTPGGSFPYLPQIALKGIRIMNSRLIFKGSRKAPPVTLKLNRLVLKSSRVTDSCRLVASARYNRMPLAIKGSLGSIGRLLKQEKPWPFEIFLSAVDSKLKIKGVVKDFFSAKGIELDAAFESRDISKPAFAAGFSLPVKNPVKIKSHITGNLKESIRFSKLKLFSGPNVMHGFVLVKLKSGKPYIHATLTSDRLDLRELIHGKRVAAEKNDPKLSRRIFSAEPFPTGLLKKADARVSVRIKRCLFPKTAMQNLNLNLSLKNGRMIINPVSAIVGSGKLQAGAAIREVKNKLVGTVMVKIDNMDAGRMLKELDISKGFEGKFDVAANLSGRGRSVADFMSGLNGYFSVSMGSGSFNNRLLGLLGGNLRAGLFQLLNMGGKQDELTEINCFVTRLDMVDGIAYTRVLVLDTQAIRAVGKGTVNLKNEKLDISLKPIPKKGLGATGVGKINVSFGNLAKPFKLGGTLADPELAIDPAKAAITIGKAFGGFALFGPFGLAALLVDGDAAKKDLCAAAVAIARQKKNIWKKSVPGDSKKTGAESPDTFLDGLKKVFNQTEKSPRAKDHPGP